jgi:hypothetical protein
LNTENVGEIAVVGLRPKMRVRARIDQLSVDPNTIFDALYAAFDYMRDSELSPDLAQVPLTCVLVLHHAGVADHFQVRHSRQTGENFALDAVCKEGVFRIFAQVLKGQNRNAFFWWCWERGSKVLTKQPDHGADEEKTKNCSTGQNWIALRPTPDSRWRPDWPRENRSAFEPTLKIFRERACSLVTRFRIAFETTGDNRFQVATHGRYE